MKKDSVRTESVLIEPFDAEMKFAPMRSDFQRALERFMKPMMRFPVGIKRAKHQNLFPFEKTTERRLQTRQFMIEFRIVRVRGRQRRKTLQHFNLSFQQAIKFRRIAHADASART